MASFEIALISHTKIHLLMVIKKFDEKALKNTRIICVHTKYISHYFRRILVLTVVRYSFTNEKKSSKLEIMLLQLSSIWIKVRKKGDEKWRRWRLLCPHEKKLL